MTLPTPPKVGLRTALVAGVPLTISTPKHAVDWLLDEVEGGSGVDVRFVNAYSIVSAHDDERYLDLVQHHGVSFPDGTPVAWALRRTTGRKEAQRVRGPGFFVDTLAASAGRNVRHFFLGVTDPTLQQLTARVHASWPSVHVAGVYSPAFAPVDDAMLDECVRRVRASGANCVWVALGTPKQDVLAARLADRLGMPCLAVGAAFDFAAGTKREAPRWMQDRGLEWMHRLASEPGRLWRRYLIGNVRFLLLIARQPRA